ncbi:MAG TPA: AraC family transcriptional regulator [Pyrinomonadaceae bacterium]|nr:AraC family transcriptional regulator [Pyrinomonadaceae bacterium]
MLVFHPAGETHAQRFDGLPVHLFRVELAKTRIKDTRLRKHDLAACHFRRGEAIGLALKLYREFRDPDTVSPLVIEGLALELTAVVARNSLRPSGETIHPPQRWLRAAHELIKSRFRETLALNDIAQAVGIHPVTLAREFRKVYGHTIGEMVRRERIGFACDQIVKGDVTLSELGISAGFYDQSHFAKTFKRLLGVTPSEYRRHYLLD